MPDTMQAQNNQPAPSSAPKKKNRAIVLVAGLVAVVLAVVVVVLWRIQGQTGAAGKPKIAPLVLPQTLQQAMEPKLVVPIKETEDHIGIAVSPTGLYLLKSQLDASSVVEVWKFAGSEYSKYGEVDLSVTDKYLGQPLQSLNGTNVAWSADESKFAFYLKDAMVYFSDSDIFVCDVATLTVQCVTDDGTEPSFSMGSSEEVSVETSPVFSPDGSTIYFSSWGKVNGLCKVPVNGGAITTVVETSMDAWLSDVKLNGNTLCYIVDARDEAKQGLYSLPLNAQKNGAKKLASGGPVYLLDISWNGEFVLAIRVDLKQYTQELVLLNTKTGEETLIPGQQKLDVFGKKYEVRFNNAAFSPDGTQIVLAMDTMDSEAGLLVSDLSLENLHPVYWAEDNAFFSNYMGVQKNYSTLRWLRDNSFIVTPLAGQRMERIFTQ